MSMILWTSQITSRLEILWLNCIFGKTNFLMNHWVSPKAIKMNSWQWGILYLVLKVNTGNIKSRTKIRILGEKLRQQYKWKNISGVIWSLSSRAHLVTVDQDLCPQGPLKAGPWSGGAAWQLDCSHWLMWFCVRLGHQNGTDILIWVTLIRHRALGCWWSMPILWPELHVCAHLSSYPSVSNHSSSLISSSQRHGTVAGILYPAYPLATGSFHPTPPSGFTSHMSSPGVTVNNSSEGF